MLWLARHPVGKHLLLVTGNVLLFNRMHMYVCWGLHLTRRTIYIQYMLREGANGLGLG